MRKTHLMTNHLLQCKLCILIPSHVCIFARCMLYIDLFEGKERNEKITTTKNTRSIAKYASLCAHWSLPVFAIDFACVNSSQSNASSHQVDVFVCVCVCTVIPMKCIRFIHISIYNQFYAFFVAVFVLLKMCNVRIYVSVHVSVCESETYRLV